MEIKNVAYNQKQFKIAPKKLLQTHFTQFKSALVNRELRAESQDFIIAVRDLRFCLCALCEYS